MEEELLRVRREKLDKLREAGINPYPYKYERDAMSQELTENFEALGVKDDTQLDNPDVRRIRVCGRIMSLRSKGKTAFAHIMDPQGKIQIYVRKDAIGEAAYEAFSKLYDIGDHIGVKGVLFKTHSGEITIKAEEVVLLSKSMRPLPAGKEKINDDGTVQRFSAMDDVELRYRQRYADLILRPEVRDTFEKRSRVISGIREFLDKHGYLEVETPILQPLYGGASARPFVTHHNALDIKLYMRIALELYLKRLIVGGIDRVYEISKIFRNEGMDRTHNPEFTMLEFYAAYQDFNDLMTFTEDMLGFVCHRVHGKDSIESMGHTVSFKPPYERLSMFDAIKKYTQIDVSAMDEAALREVCKTLHIPTEKSMDRGKLIDEIFSAKVQEHLIQPVFITEQPIEISPLAKKHRSKNGVVERFELFILGSEVANAFSELNDPLDQRERFEAQMGLRARGDEEAQVLDEDFLRALEYGMPPTAGEGIGIDRLVMIMTGQDSIRDVLFFPTMRPE
ncbi:MAG TPA: lysine--tRNA ligase [bacterium]|nr:lysine--tRNA ligase [bacterium]HMW35561.1 lysine--tRNA ligase [bacterium]HMY34798.1 lysine--tRNA ligase [bacterium]HMZ03915.1 lysine--tRNA ligase [bacterium]HNB08606.1 lysine--tRNA ligase [bacterium]